MCDEFFDVVPAYQFPFISHQMDYLEIRYDWPIDNLLY